MKKFFLSLLILTILAAISYFLFISDYFKIEIVEIKGVYSLEPTRIEETAGIKFGENIFLQNNFLKEKTIRKKFTLIDKVRIKQELPNKVIVEITEKMPVLILLDEGTYVFLDKNGEVLNIDNKLNQSTAPILTGIELKENIKTGQVIVMSEVREAIEFSLKVPDDKRYLINEVTVDDYGLSIYPTGSYRALIGKNENIVKKLKTLETLSRDSELLGNTIKYIDVSNPDKIILKTKEDLS